MSSQLQVSGEAKIRDIQGPVIANSGVITALDGAASQYVRGDGTLADFPTSTGGGSSVSYYLNSSVSQGTIGGVAYRELSKEPIIGAGTDITISANGYVASYITDTNDPDVLLVPGGNFNCEFYFSVNNNTGNPTTYAELYKYDGTTFTLLGSSQAVPESLNQGTTIAPYYFAIPVATAALALTDRLAIRIYVNVDGRTVTLHTENSHLCQVVTTFSKGMVSLNNLTDQSQFITTGTSGTNFAIVSSGDTHTFNLPVASATNTGKLSSTDWSTFNGKVPYTGATANVDLGNFNFDANNISGAAIIAKLNGPASSPFVLKSGSSGYTIGDDAISLISSPNVANTLILASNIGVVTKTAQIGLGSLTATRTFTLPDISGTLALLEGTQTFSGAKTFSLDILVNGLTIGRGAGSISTNTVVGSSALSANTTGYGNTSIGLNNLIANTTGFFNVAIGASSLISNTTGTYNAALGTSSLYNNTTGSNNTAVGQQSGESNTTGSNNTYIGRGSGYGIETGSNNTIIGAYTGTAALANNIVLADGAGNVRYQWNGTNNVFGNPISGTSASFSSSVTASSLIKSGGTSSQFLMADGSVNTSVLPSGAYLPLTGGTLTGGLSGTTATFSGLGTFYQLTMTGATAGRIFYAQTGGVVSQSGNLNWNETNGMLGVGTPNPSAVITAFSNNAATQFKAAGTAPAFTFSESLTTSTYACVFGLATSANHFITGTAAGDMAIANQSATAGAIVFGTGTAEKMRMSPSGRLLVGTSVDSGALFQVNGTTNLTGALSGTSATFSGNMGVGGGTTEIAGFTSITISNSSSGSFLDLNNSGVNNLRFLSLSSVDQRIQAAGNLRFDTAGTKRFEILSSGAATFSSSVTAGTLSRIGDVFIGGRSGTYASYTDGVFGDNLHLGATATGGAVYINTALSRNLIINPVGGNVGIGTSSPTHNLEIANASGSVYQKMNADFGIGYFGMETADDSMRFVTAQATPIQFYTNNTERMRITSGGAVQVGIAAAATNVEFNINGVVNKAGRIQFQESGVNRWLIGNGAASENGRFEIFDATNGTGVQLLRGATSWTALSDERFKDIIEPIIVLDKLKDVRAVIGKYKTDNENIKRNFLIAQDLLKVFPEVVDVDVDESKPMGVRYTDLIPVLVKAIQEQTQIIKDLEARIKQLENK